MAQTATLLENNIHPKFRRDTIHRVFHLNHAEQLKLKSLENIVGDSWLDLDAKS